MAALQIYDPRERAVVATADRVLSALRPILRLSRFDDGRAPRRILLLRLERIGDLMMALPAIASVRALAPDAEIDLVVGSWNRTLAEAIPHVTRVETLDASWLARDSTSAGPGRLLRRALGWRRRRYDLGVNFEPDIRSNVLLALSGARRTAGFRSGGGGPLLDVTLEYDLRRHTTANAHRLVECALGRPAPDAKPELRLPDPAVHGARALLPGPLRRPIVGVHASGGRPIKQWDPSRFGDVAARLVHETGATIVLTGTTADRLITNDVRAMVPANHVVDLSGQNDLPTLAAVLDSLDVLITGDTGPMHLAAAVGTPVVAVFGPSDPVRYGPPGPADRVVRVDLPCSPCNRIRRPPERCTGHTPDCLAQVSAEQVYQAVRSSLAEAAAVRDRAAGRARP
ncbi:MAG TPA: glycosyltransferase family 9 protein [Vicinamibacterales bacterium]|nr:glycosyltransferase family 9 protein [Vicinamibacterales bacterium]